LSGDGGVGYRFPLASLSKPITAAVVRDMARRGELTLDSPVMEVYRLPIELDSRYSLMTIKNLLQHTSGLNQLAGDPMFNRDGLVGCKRALGIGLSKPLAAPPGQKMQYSNTGYCLLGEIVGRVGNASYEDVVLRFLSRVGVDQAFTYGPPDRSVPHFTGGLTPEQWRAAGAAGGWFSDALSVAKLFSFDARDSGILGDRPVGFHNGQGWYYGLGWRVWNSRSGYKLTHFGSLPGMFSVAVAYPDGRAGVLLLNDRPIREELFAQNAYVLIEEQMEM
jgi:CubicO group peptidase (beta-lactamase class C family)